MIQIYVAGQEKISHLLVDPSTPTTDDWTLDDIVILHQILTTMEPKIYNLVFRCMTMKEL